MLIQQQGMGKVVSGMRTKGWKKIFMFSVAIHLLFLTAIAYNMQLNVEMGDCQERGPILVQPIEVQLSAVASEGVTGMIEPKATLGTHNMGENIPDKQSNFDGEKRPVSQAVQSAVNTDQANATVSDARKVGGELGKDKAGNQGDGNPSGSGTSSDGAAKKGTSSGGRTAGVSVLYGPVPSYPEEARSQGWEGTVKIKVLISEQGTVKEVSLARSSGHDSMDQEALAVVQRWQFSPAFQDGKAMVAWVIVPVVFSLQ